MPETDTTQLIEKEIELVRASGFGEVTIKIKNGAVYRVLHTIDRILDLTNKES